MCSFGKYAAIIVAAATVLVSTAAHASFHLWIVDQIFSDASGNVQYVQFSTTFGGQELMTFTSLQATLGMATNNFPFPSDLPITAGSTTNKKFIVATQGFVNLGILPPDYVVPNGFLFKPSGTITLVGADTITYSALPSDGALAIDRFGNSVAPRPTNFAGSSACLPVPIPAGAYDVDGNGSVDALTDGLLLIRYMFGLRGAALITNAVSPCATRGSSAAVEAHIASQIP